jgi:hypothetical protein
MTHDAHQQSRWSAPINGSSRDRDETQALLREVQEKVGTPQPEPEKGSP